MKETLRSGWFKWGSQRDYERDYRIAWAASTPHVRSLIAAMRLRGRKMYLHDPLKGGIPTGLWEGRTRDNRYFEVDFNGNGRLQIRGALGASIGMSGTEKPSEWETMWVRKETWSWIVDEIIGGGPLKVVIPSDIHIGMFTANIFP